MGGLGQGGCGTLGVGGGSGGGAPAVVASVEATARKSGPELARQRFQIPSAGNLNRSRTFELLRFMHS